MIENKPNTSGSCQLKLDSSFDTTILLVRHGESLGNANREFLGHTNKDLSELGYKQAEITASYLSEIEIDKVYSSDLLRAHNTAKPHAELRGLEVCDSSELREIYAGLWEGKKVEDIIAEYNGFYHNVWRDNFGECELPEGESVPHLGERIFCEVKRIAEENRGRTVLIGCHAAAIRAFWGKITETKPSDLALAYPFPTNASVSVVYYDGANLIAGEYSHDVHLLNI